MVGWVTDARLFFRAVQADGGLWWCRRGRTTYDVHDRLDEAVEHLIQLAAGLGPVAVFAHHLDGRVEQVVSLES